jgi:hypothetical protein
VAGGGAATEVMLKVTHTIPIVYVIVPDPVGFGFVESLSQPGGNATGFMMFEYNLCGKWLELLKEIAPSVTHAAVLRDARTAAAVIAHFHDLCSLENDQSKTHYRQRGSNHRRCHAWIRQNFLYENNHGKRSNPK